ncbi:MAG: choice-of-anchor V domain-containing protein [Pseudomonadota bacterium]|nr:choice-of-anchor V domain-containing protein [Pseudomonadota bacterium]
MRDRLTRNGLVALFAKTSYLAGAAALVGSTAVALPEGSPWGSANPQAAEHCGTCHFGYDAETDAEALVLRGLPEKPVPGKTYELQIIFDDPEAIVAGFQLLASDGEFKANTGNIEYLGAAIRSTRAWHADEGFSWTLSWIAPEAPSVAVPIYIAAVGGNDDLSPFGDRAFFRTYETSL